MPKRITRVSPVQAGKVLAVFYGIISVPFVLIMVLASLFGGRSSGMSLGFLILVPVLYVIFGFIFSVIAAWLYNLVAKWTGGIELTLEETPSP